VRRQAEAHELPLLVVDGTKTKDETYEWACEKLEVDKVMGQPAPVAKAKQD
jgi:hypothetical protein